jgi:hypothetical protein
MAKIPVNASCGLCGSPKQLHRHHLDWDHSNNSPSNVVILCQRCHTVLHNKVGYITLEELAAVREQVMARDPSRFGDTETDEPGVQPTLFKL